MTNPDIQIVTTRGADLKIGDQPIGFIKHQVDGQQGKSSLIVLDHRLGIFDTDVVRAIAEEKMRELFTGETNWTESSGIWHLLQIDQMMIADYELGHSRIHGKLLSAVPTFFGYRLPTVRRASRDFLISHVRTEINTLLNEMRATGTWPSEAIKRFTP